MANIRFLYNNLIDSASLTASSEVATLPATNVQDPRSSAKWRTTDDASENLVIDLGSAKAIDSFILINHNISSSITSLKIQGHTSDSWGSPDIDIDLLDPVGDTSYNVYQSGIIVWYFTSSSKQYWRFVIVDDSNPDGYIEVGRMFLGSYFEPTDDKASVYNFLINDRSELNPSLDGTLYSNIKGQQYESSFVLPRVLSDPAGTDDLQSLINMFVDIGINKDFILSFNPDKGSQETVDRYSNLKRWSWYGRLVQALQIQHDSNLYYSLPFNFRESI